MEIQFNIITPLKDAGSLEKIQASIFPQTKRHNVRWFVVFDAKKPPVYPLDSWIYYYCCRSREQLDGSEQYNFVLDILTRSDGWVYFLPGDTVLHPLLLDTVSAKLREAKNENRQLRGFSFKVDGSGMESSDLLPGHYILERESIYDTRFTREHNFWQEFVRRPNKKEIETIPEILAYHKKLEKVHG